MNETDGDKKDPGQKALHINLDATKYGTFAEIGAGQEVCRWFFHAGGASGTVAKTISAYDMAVSDAIYGLSDRYVSRQRLQSMLDYEYNLILQRLDKKRGDKTAFFVFADTVATHSFSRQTDGHGWLGIKFQAQPREEASQIIIHTRLLDRTVVREQEALGIIGVNLIYAAFYHHSEPEKIISMLMDDLNRERIEIEMIKFSGPCFAKVDNRLMALQLVQQNVADGAMFTSDGEVVIPSEVLYKKAALVERGSFRPITKTTLDILERAQEQFLREPQMQGESPVVLMEMTLHSVLEDATLAHKDFLDRVDLLSTLGKPVLISNFGRYYRLVEYLSRYTQKMKGIALGIPSLRSIFDEKFYTDLSGGLLESLGRLFKDLTKLYVYPMREPSANALAAVTQSGSDSGIWQRQSLVNEIVTPENLKVAPNLRHLYAHLLENGYITGIQNYNPDYLSLFPPFVLSKLQSGDVSWENDVPGPIVEIIKKGKMFGWRERPTMILETT
ncbi:MAG TPA: TonB-dependent receptor [Alphaproteobacteria bacterium]|nr:TonB-dependent receptor [Alphaproteobacteria bacterium]